MEYEGKGQDHSKYMIHGYANITAKGIDYVSVFIKHSSYKSLGFCACNESSLPS